MTNLFNRILLRPLPMSPADVAYARAVSASDDLLLQMRDASSSRDPARAVMAEIWQQRHNVPFMTTVHEAVKEMVSPMRGYTEARAFPLKDPK